MLTRAYDPGVLLHKPSQAEYDAKRSELLHPETLWEVEDHFGRTHWVLATHVRQAIDRFAEWAQHENNPNNIATVKAIRSTHGRIIQGKVHPTG